MKYYLLISTYGANIKAFGHIANMKMTGISEFENSARQVFLLYIEIAAILFHPFLDIVHCLPAGLTVKFEMEERTPAMSQSGTVKFFNTEKGFGFITPEDGGKDVFVHISAVQASGMESLTENQQITFETEPDNRGKGPKAINIQVA